MGTTTAAAEIGTCEVTELKKEKKKEKRISEQNVSLNNSPVGNGREAGESSNIYNNHNAALEINMRTWK